MIFSIDFRKFTEYNIPRTCEAKSGSVGGMWQRAGTSPEPTGRLRRTVVKCGDGALEDRTEVHSFLRDLQPETFAVYRASLKARRDSAPAEL